MSFEHEKRVAGSILSAIEDAGTSPAQTFDLIRDADPALVHFIFGWLRAHYPSTHPSGDGVLTRLAALCTEHPQAARMARVGESDSIVGWFEDGHSYRDFAASDFIDLVVEKLEG